MKYSRFEELPVWKDAIELAVRVYRFTAQPAFNGRYSLKDQLERAAVSVSNNVAEGFERGTTQETLTFLYIARGSAGETRSILCLCERLAWFSDLKFEISDLKSQGGEHLQTVATLVWVNAELGHSGRAVPDQSKSDAIQRSP